MSTRREELTRSEPAEEAQVSSQGGERRQTDETSGKGKGRGNGGKGEHGSKGGLGSTGTQEAQLNTMMMNGADEDELEEKEQEEECDGWECTH